ncbi:MAG: NifB/NifX family molybdenum-iron cluster-binding protein [Thermodesulfobacteriota bacterium]|nr:NifB/NifX family molybdenum-iron cluster-binding protein [Thermodesulfobacteriota bacterium]
MKIAVSASGSDLKDQADPRFGRCAYFHILDMDTGEHEAISNASAAAGGGAGISAAQSIVEKGAGAVVTGNCGPNAFQVFNAAGIKVFIGAKGSVSDAVDAYKAGKLSASQDANVKDHFGMGSGQGMGGGGGGGMGRRRR